MIRHHTATGFIVYREKILLHYHPKVREWLPPGGHIEKNEDPLEAIVREINEETGLSSDYKKYNDFVFPVQRVTISAKIPNIIIFMPEYFF